MNPNRSLLTFALSFLSILLTEAAPFTYTPLDTDDPVRLEGDTVIYRAMKFIPAADCFFIDSRLSDSYCDAHPFTFNSFTSAAKHFTDGTAEDPMRVYIAPGVYWIDDPDDPEIRTGNDGHEPFGLVIRCNALQLTGLTSNPRNVVLAAARGQTQGAWGNFTMLDITSDDFLAENLTLGNFCNVDLEFPLDPSLNRPKRNSAITQAHVAYLHGDRAIARNVRFISRLNMNPLNGARRILFDRCHLESTDDALTGTGVYLNCDLDFYAPRPFWNTHENGAVFLNCDFNIRHSSGRQYFCKSVGPLAIIDCRYHAPDDSVYVGWTHYPTPWLRCYQSGVTLNGRPVTIGSEREENTVEISRMPLLDAFRVNHSDTILYNTYNLLRGDDNWDPLGIRPFIEAESNRQIRDLGAIPSFLGMDRREARITTGDEPLTVTASSFRHAGFSIPSGPVSWSLSPGDSAFVRIIPDGNSCTIIPVNETDSAMVVNLTAATTEGHQAVTSLTVAPALLPAPLFIRHPSLSVSDKKVHVDYQLDLGSRTDRSVVNWYRATKPDGSDARLVAVSRYGQPMTSYPLHREDAGNFIMAEVYPAHIRSEAAEPISTGVIAISSADTDPSLTLDTDFANFPTGEYPDIIPGYWNVGGFKPADTAEFTWNDESGEYWYYGTGINGATGRGLSQRRKGARLMFTPVEGEYGDMSLTLLVDPAKTAGQGFGSATGQYMDVALKFDTRTLTGYGLRIIRTTDFSNAVSFYLIEYSDGVVTPLTEPVAATCYRTGCTISLDCTDGLLTARVTTSTPLSRPTDPRLATEVNLSAPVKPNPFGGIHIQHTGSTGESATMLHHLKADWR